MSSHSDLGRTEKNEFSSKQVHKSEIHKKKKAKSILTSWSDPWGELMKFLQQGGLDVRDTRFGGT